MIEITVNPKSKYPRPYWPQELKDDGFVGDLSVLVYSSVAVILPPGYSWDQVRKSLELALKDVTMRIEKEKLERGRAKVE